MSTDRGVATTTRWEAQCKDCGRRGDPADFVYPDAWIEGVVERGGTRSDRCPRCRQRHARDARSMAVPYIDLETVGQVADRENPTGPLGGLGPLPPEHRRDTVKSDLSRFDFGLTDNDVNRLLAGLEKKQVAIVVAGTGSGKSTFLPYRLLVPPDDATLHLADRGPIIVTEPRVFATIDVATFIATELHGAPSVGPGCDIGYRVKGKPVFDSGCRLLFVTDGSLINWLRDGALDKFGAIVIDEAHERSKNIDVILALLRAELPKHPNLRVIVLSATIDPEFFSDFFGGKKKVLVLDDIKVKKKWGYGKPLWPDDPVQLDHPDWADDKEFRGKPLRDIAEHLATLRVLKGREISVASWRDQMPQLVAEQAVKIARGTDWGDVLGFLPGKAAIDAAVGMIEKQLVEAGIAKCWDVYGLLRSTPEDEQRDARCARQQGDKRRIVISTNIAETSLTIDGVTYVVDSGLINQSKWDVATASKSVLAIPHSKDGVRQRWGRVGRKAPGWVFPLYTRGQFEELLDHTPPEAVRDDLESLVLTAKAAGIDNPTDFDWPAAFKRPGVNEKNEKAAQFRDAFKGELKRSVTALERRGALDAEGDVTDWGNELLGFSGSPAEAGAIAGADELSCAVEAVTAITLLSGSTLIGPKGVLLFDERWTPTARNVARRCHEAITLGCRDELDLALKLYAAWERAGDRKEAWANANCVNHDLLVGISATCGERLEFLSPGRKSPVSEPMRLELAPRVRAVLSRALVDYTFVRSGSRWVAAESPDNVTYRLANCSWLEQCNRVVALRRRAAGGGGLLSGLVASFEWAANAGSWTELALEVSHRLRRADGGLPGPTTAETLIFQDDWPVGVRVRCAFDAKGTMTAAELVSPPPPDPLAVQDVEESELDPDGEPTEAGTMESAPTAEQRPGDLVGVLQEPGDALVNPEMEAQFQDLEELEANEGSGDKEKGTQTSDSADRATDEGPPFPLEPGSLESRPQLSLDWDESPSEGDLLLRVVGYEGLGEDRVVRAVAEPGDGELDSGLAEAIEAGEERRTRTLEPVAGWGAPFLVAQDTESGLDVCVAADELTLRGDDEEAARQFEAGTSLEVKPLHLREAHAAIAASRLPELQRHLEEAESVAPVEGAAPFYPARVFGKSDNGRAVEVRLEHGDESRGLVHQFTVPMRALQRGKIRTAERTPLLVQLKPEVSEEASGWIERRLSHLPDGLEELCDGERLTAQQGSPTILRASPDMSKATHEKLLALSDGKAWRRAVNELWHSSTQADGGRGKIDGWVIKPISKAPPGLAELCDDDLLQLESGQPGRLKATAELSEELRDQLLQLNDNSYWQSLIDGLWRKVTGERDVAPDANGWFEQGITSVPAGLPELCDARTLAYQEPRPAQLLAGPNMSEELRDQLLALADTQIWQGTAYNLWQESNGGGLASIGSDGWVQRQVAEAPDGLDELLGDGLVFIQGQETLLRAAPLMSLVLRDSLLALYDDDTWRGIIAKVWRQTNALGVSRVQHLDAPNDLARPELPAEGSQVTGTVTDVQNFGVIVQLDKMKRTVLLHKSSIGDFGVADPSRFFAIGDEIEAEVKATEAKRGRSQIQLAIPGVDLELEAARCSLTEGEPFEGTVSNVVEFGVFVDLGDAVGLVHKTAIGSGGRVLDPRRLFSIGQELSGRINGIARSKKGKLEVNLDMPDFELPSLLDQVREAYPEGASERGTIDAVVDLGAFVRLRYGLTGLVSSRKMSAADRGKIAGLKAGDPVDVAVLRVRMGKRRVEIDLALV